MAFWHGEKGKTPTGATIHIGRKKRKYELGNSPLMTKMGKDKRYLKNTKGGGMKLKARSAEFVNVLNPKNKKTMKLKILDVVSNPANPHFVRRKVMTKGCVIKTEIGNARITSRPSQHGIVNAVLVE